MPDFPGTIDSKLPRVGTTIFTVMSQLAAEHQAINLSQGFPDFGCDPELAELVYQHIQAGHNQYAPMAGLPLRVAVADKVLGLYATRYDPEHEITITAGATQALFTAVLAVVRPGDEVIVFEPAYDSYVPAIELAGGTAVYTRLQVPGYTVDWDEVARLITPRTRMIMINTPNNPTGSVWSAEDMQALAQLTAGSNIVIVSDEVYEHILFDGRTHQSAARFPELAARSFIVSSFGKTYHVTGWKVGYCLGPRNLMAEFRKVHQFNVFTVNTPVQHALAAFMQQPEHHLGLAGFYQAKRDFFIEQLNGSRFSLRPSAGTYFQLLGYADISGEADRDLAVRWTRELGVASIPVSVFYHRPEDHKVLRFCFAKSAETLTKAAEILRRI